MNRLKLVGYTVAGVLVLNLMLLAFGLVNWIFFWAVIGLGAIFVWKGLPWLKTRS